MKCITYTITVHCTSLTFTMTLWWRKFYNSMKSEKKFTRKLRNPFWLGHTCQKKKIALRSGHQTTSFFPEFLTCGLRFSHPLHLPSRERKTLAPPPSDIYGVPQGAGRSPTLSKFIGSDSGPDHSIWRSIKLFWYGGPWWPAPQMFLSRSLLQEATSVGGPGGWLDREVIRE